MFLIFPAHPFEQNIWCICLYSTKFIIEILTIPISMVRNFMIWEAYLDNI